MVPSIPRTDAEYAGRAVSRTAEARSPTDRLHILAKEIRRTYDDLEQVAKAAAERAVDLGRALMEAKRLCDHGQWLPWLTANTLLSHRQAQKYMRLASLVTAGQCELEDAFSLQRVLAASAATPERKRATAVRVASEPIEARCKPLAPDMRSAVEALMASDPALHREFLVAASEQLLDIDTTCAVMRALLSRKHPKNVATLLVDVLGRREFARVVADAMIEQLDAQMEAHAEAALGREAT